MSFIRPIGANVFGRGSMSKERERWKERGKKRKKVRKRFKERERERHSIERFSQTGR